MDTLSHAPQPVSKKKFIFLGVIIVGILCLGAYFLYKKQHAPSVNSTHVFTEEERLDTLKGLHTPPPADGSVLLTEDDKLKILNDISHKKPQMVDKTARSLSDSERTALMNSAGQ